MSVYTSLSAGISCRLCVVWPVLFSTGCTSCGFPSHLLSVGVLCAINAHTLCTETSGRPCYISLGRSVPVLLGFWLCIYCMSYSCEYSYHKAQYRGQYQRPMVCYPVIHLISLHILTLIIILARCLYYITDVCPDPLNKVDKAAVKLVQLVA